MSRRLDPTLYLVTDPELTRGRALLEVVAAAVRGGVTLVQLRDKHADGRNLLETARALKAVLDPLGGLPGRESYIGLLLFDARAVATATRDRTP